MKRSQTGSWTLKQAWGDDLYSPIECRRHSKIAEVGLFVPNSTLAPSLSPLKDSVTSLVSVPFLSQSFLSAGSRKPLHRSAVYCLLSPTRAVGEGVRCYFTAQCQSGFSLMTLHCGGLFGFKEGLLSLHTTHLCCSVHGVVCAFLCGCFYIFGMTNTLLPCTLLIHSEVSGDEGVWSFCVVLASEVLRFL